MLRIIWCSFLFFLLWSTVIVIGASAAAPLDHDQSNAIKLVPDRDIVSSTASLTLWKQTWDNARNLSRNKKYDQAVDIYIALLEMKPNIVEARWELTSILLHLEQWQDAAKQLNILFVGGEKKTKYILAQAEIALHTNNEEQAELLYRELGKKKLNQSYQVKVLDGLSRSLIQQKKYADALPYARGLLVKFPDNNEYIQRTAYLYKQVGELDIAWAVLRQACQEETTDIEILRSCADLALQRGCEKDAKALWLEILAKNEDDIPALLAMIRYYKNTDNRIMELKYLEQLSQHARPDAQVLSRMMAIHLEQSKAALALYDCCFILERYPADQEMLELNKKMLHSLAVSLLEIKTLDCPQLWKELNAQPCYRLELFKTMGEILRERKQFFELTDVLFAIVNDVPGNDPLVKELEELLIQQGRTRELAKLNDALQKETL